MGMSMSDSQNTNEKNSNSEVTLARALAEGTKDVHRRAERVPWMAAFIKGSVPLPQYIDLLAALYSIYRVMEHEAAENASHPVYSSLHFPRELNRTDALAEDLRFYLGADQWRKRVDAVAEWPSVMFYLDALREASKQPHLLIAHCYTRYLGDLSGGQILAKIIHRHYREQIPADRGTAFYRFENIENMKEFKNKYRWALDNLHVSSSVADSIVDEATRAFLLNIGLFDELGERVGFGRSAPSSSSSGSEPVTPPRNNKSTKPTAGPGTPMPSDHPPVSGGAVPPPSCPFAKMAMTATPRPDSNATRL